MNRRNFLTIFATLPVFSSKQISHFPVQSKVVHFTTSGADLELEIDYAKTNIDVDVREVLREIVDRENWRIK